jgi:thiamine biosynthesis protein ThiS
MSNQLEWDRRSMNSGPDEDSVSMRIMLNGREQDIGSGTTIADLIVAQGLAGKRVAIEVNREIVPRGDYSVRALAADDRVEVVHAIGGG